MSSECKDCRHDRGTDNPMGCERGISMGCGQFQAKAEELPEIEGYEITTVGELENKEEVLLETVRMLGTRDDEKSVLMKILDGASTYVQIETPCYRLKPKLIRADEVPDLRKFVDGLGWLWRRVKCKADPTDGLIGAVRLDYQAAHFTTIMANRLVTLLPEEKTTE